MECTALTFLESLDIHPKQLVIPNEEIGPYSIRLNCILTDHQTGRRHHEISWWHNNKRLGSQTNRFARIVKNVTQHSFISTLFYTAAPANVVGYFTCESEPLRRSISVKFQTNHSRGLREAALSVNLHWLVCFHLDSYMHSYLVILGWAFTWIFLHWNIPSFKHVWSRTGDMILLCLAIQWIATVALQYFLLYHSIRVFVVLVLHLTMKTVNNTFSLLLRDKT